MSASSEHDNPPSVSSSSESESDEALAERPSGEEGEGAESQPARVDPQTRSIQVVSAAPRPRRDSADGDDDEQRTESGSSSSDSEEEAEDAEAVDGPSRGKSYLQSIRARKPKKKVYAKPKGERGTEETNKPNKNDTTKQGRHGPGGAHTSEADRSSPSHTLQRGINVQPTYNNYSSSGDNEGSEAESDAVAQDVTQSSTQALTQLAMEEGERRGSRGRRRESVFSRFNRYAGSFRVKLSKRDKKQLEEQSEESDNPDDLEGVFDPMTNDSQPEILKKDSSFRRRANKAINTAIVKPKPKKEGEEEEEGGISQLCNCCKKKKREGEKEKKKPRVKKKKPPATQLSPQLKKASSQGINMMKKVFFPALPHLLQDVWVYLEFGITLFAFIFGVLSLDLSDGSKAFNIVYLGLTILSIILASVDCFLYFVTMGSCVECIKICHGMLRRRGEENELELLEQQAENEGCCRMSKEYKQKFSTYFELVRNIVSEALLYPLLICDLFDFIVGGVFRNISTDDRLNFTLFVVGSLYLILSVYIMRMFLIIGSLVSLSRLPKMPNASGYQGNNIRLLKWFSIHIFFQIITHAILIVAVAVKIRHENPKFGEQDSIFASSFLWINVVLGGLIPIVGILSFFVTNYYYMREFTISFWIEMMAMLQAPSFTDTVFPSEDGQSSSSLQLAADFVKDSELKKVKKQFERYKSPSWYVKFFFPLKLPLLVLIGSLFVLGLFLFLASLILTQDPISPSGSEVKAVLFDDIPITVVFFLCTVLLMAFNVKIVVLVLVFFTLSAIFLIAASIMIAIMLPFVLFVYFPIGCCVTCFQCCRSTFKEMYILDTPGTKVNYFNAV